MKAIEKAQKKRKSSELISKAKDVAMTLSEHQEDLDSNPEYSLEPDPTNYYGMSSKQKEFVKYYVNFKNIAVAAELAGLDIEDAKGIFTCYSTQQEIRRINRAMYQRQFRTKMLSIEQIGSYLSALLMDENVPDADRLKTNEKLRVAQMIIDLNDYRKNAIDNPSLLTTQDVETQVKTLSIDTIRNLLYHKNLEEASKEKDKLIEQLDVDNLLTHEEILYLKTLSVKDLLELVNTMCKKEE